jgi:hypothetical protein
LQEKAQKVNAVNFEKKRKEELLKLERHERDQLLRSSLALDEDYLKADEAKKAGYSSKLRMMHEVNLKTEKAK